jgi:hypothetical protein
LPAIAISILSCALAFEVWPYRLYFGRKIKERFAYKFLMLAGLSISVAYPDKIAILIKQSNAIERLFKDQIE